VSYQVFDDGGNLRLRVTSPQPPGETSGSVVEYFPTGPTRDFRVDYFFRMEQGPALAGANAFLQEIVLSPLGTNLWLYWGNDNQLRIDTSAPGSSSSGLLDTGYLYTPGTAYLISWDVRGSAGEFSVYANGAALGSNLALPGPVTGLNELAFSNNFSTTGVQVIDEVRIGTVPEPATRALLAVGLLGMGAVTRRQLRPVVGRRRR
jgi:hypothetical protein